MNIYKTKSFERWARKEKLDDVALVKAVAEMKAGLVDADLGGGLFKKRIARTGSGKRAGYRTILATNKSDRWFFVFGFAKNERENIDLLEREELEDLASLLLRFSREEIGLAVAEKRLFEVITSEEEISDNGISL